MGGFRRQPPHTERYPCLCRYAIWDLKKSRLQFSTSKPGFQLLQGLASVRYQVLSRVSNPRLTDPPAWTVWLIACFRARSMTSGTYLLILVHLGICLALILEDRIPTCWALLAGCYSVTRKNDEPNFCGPLAGTTLPFVRPWNRIGSSPGPAQYANVQTAKAVLSSYAASRLFKPSWPRATRKCFLSGRQSGQRTPKRLYGQAGSDDQEVIEGKCFLTVEPI